MRSGARIGSPLTIAMATFCDWCRACHVIAPAAANAAVKAAATSISELCLGAKRIAPPRVTAGLHDPYCCQSERRPGINSACGHPHDEPSQLLVLQWRQAPFERGRGLRLIEHSWRERHQSAEYAGMQHRDEQMPSRDAAYAALQYPPPKQ